MNNAGVADEINWRKAVDINLVCTPSMHVEKSNLVMLYLLVCLYDVQGFSTGGKSLLSQTN